jgi:hypothetical protein
MILVGGLFVAFAAPANGGYRIRVTAGSHAVRWAPVSLELPKELAGKFVMISDARTKGYVPTQKDSLDGKPALTWLIGELPAGGKMEYELTSPPAGSIPSETVSLFRVADDLEIRLNGGLFIRYVTKAGPKPYFWPIIGPTGKPVTRAFPMRDDVPDEAHDHPHHRSLWFTFDRVNDHDFWSESPKAGKTVHREYLHVTGGPVFGEFAARVDWISKEGVKICEDIRRMRVFCVPGAQLFDFEIRVIASEGDLSFGDSKEGLFAFRVAESMKVDQPKGSTGGTLINANGQRNRDAWGKRAQWCDYSGPVDGNLVGIAILDHPANFRHPTYWHARTYGLFAANPFGVRQFTGEKTHDGSHKIKRGDALRLRYRVYIHVGDHESARVAEVYRAYASAPSVRIESQ